MGTISKGLSLLNFFSTSRHSIGLSEMTRLSGMNKATVYRLLGELQAAGFVEQHGPEKNYRLGIEVLRLAKLREAAVPTLEIGRDILRDLSQRTGETAHMSMVQGDRLIEIAHVYSPAHATRVIMDDAEILSFHGTSSGLAVLAFSAQPFIDRMISGALPAHTAQTLTDPAAILNRLEEVRANGVAVSDGGFEEDVCSHATPFFDGLGRPVGAIAVAAPVNRMQAAQRQRTLPLVHRAGLELTRQTGGHPPDSYPRPR